MNNIDISSFKEIIEDAMDIDLDEFYEDTNLYYDLGMDSIGAVAMSVEIQRKYKVRISEERLPELQTVKLIMDEIYNLSSNQQ